MAPGGSATLPCPFDLTWQGSGAIRHAMLALREMKRNAAAFGIMLRATVVTAPPLEPLFARTGDSDTHHGQGRVPFKAV